MDRIFRLLGWHNAVPTQTTIADSIGIKKSHVSEAFALLVKIGMLQVVSRNGREKRYMLNPHLAWLGRGARDRAKFAREWDVRAQNKNLQGDSSR